MIFIEALLITVLCCTCCYVTVTDLKKGIIQNKVLLIAGTIGLFANAVYYAFFARDLVLAFVLNLIVMIVLSVALYALHIWAAGDSKLLMLTIFLIPTRIYYEGNYVTATTVILIIIFSIAYLFVLAESLYLGINQKNIFKINKLKPDIKLMLFQYIKCTCLVTIFSFIMRVCLPEFYNSNLELMMLINMLIVLFSYGIKFLDKPLPLTILVVVSIASYICSNGMDFNLKESLKTYPLVLVVLILRLFAEKYNYKTIPTSQVEKGMVLAYSTVLLFMPSNIKGLPKETTEDIRSKINEEEVASIKRWENSKFGQGEISIVRKIPFAIFISIGTLIYTFLRVLILI